MTNTIFITGTGTDVGKTIVAAVLTEALEADYWKPVQAGFDKGTDSLFIQNVISNKRTTIHPETYKLKLAASPHIAAREERIKIEPDKIAEQYNRICSKQPTTKEPLTLNSQRSTEYLIVEGAGGLMVPLNESNFVMDLIKKINAKVILVSRNCLGSINHSLLTATVCRQNNIDVLGWIFNDHYMHYEDEIVRWSGYTKIASLPFAQNVDTAFIKEQALLVKPKLPF